VLCELLLHASVLVCLVRGMDILMKVIRCSRPTLPHGVAGSRSADHAEALSWALQRTHGQAGPR